MHTRSFFYTSFSFISLLLPHSQSHVRPASWFTKAMPSEDVGPLFRKAGKRLSSKIFLWTCRGIFSLMPCFLGQGDPHGCLNTSLWSILTPLCPGPWRGLTVMLSLGLDEPAAKDSLKGLGEVAVGGWVGGGTVYHSRLPGCSTCSMIPWSFTQTQR